MNPNNHNKKVKWISDCLWRKTNRFVRFYLILFLFVIIQNDKLHYYRFFDMRHLLKGWHRWDNDMKNQHEWMYWNGMVDAQSSTSKNLYQLLGISEKATVKEIKSAYRRKALDTHPDKNKNVAPEVAAEEFRQVVHAFEILSDPTSRQRYDRTGRTDDSQQQQQRGQQQQQYHNFHQFTWNFYHYRPIKLKDRFDVQQAMSRVLHVISLEQFRTILLDDDDRFEKNILICFTTAQLEPYVDNEMVYPYPFAAMSSQGIWWEDILQTVKVRFHVSNELTKFFDVTAHEIDSIKQPIFLFGKRHMIFNDINALTKMNRLQTNDRNEFETWMWKQIEITVHFVNRHHSPVELWWIHHHSAHLKGTCQVDQVCDRTTMLTHEWYVRDVIVDTFPGSPGRHKLTKESSLGSYKILNDTDPFIIIIPHKTCYDHSGHCTFYRAHGECHKNPNFMNQYCRLSCQQCNPADDDDEHNHNNNKNDKDEL